MGSTSDNRRSAERTSDGEYQCLEMNSMVRGIHSAIHSHVSNGNVAVYCVRVAGFFDDRSVSVGTKDESEAQLHTAQSGCGNSSRLA